MVLPGHAGLLVGFRCVPGLGSVYGFGDCQHVLGMWWVLPTRGKLQGLGVFLCVSDTCCWVWGVLPCVGCIWFWGLFPDLVIQPGSKGYFWFGVLLGWKMLKAVCAPGEAKPVPAGAAASAPREVLGLLCSLAGVPAAQLPSHP